MNGWDSFLDLCKSAENNTILTELFELLLTPEEKSSIETRCLIVQALLEQKKAQRQISSELHVSIAKITRGSNELKRISAQLKQFLQKKLLNTSRDET